MPNTVESQLNASAVGHLHVRKNEHANGGGTRASVAPFWRRLTQVLGTVVLLSVTGCAGMQEGSTTRTAGEAFDDTYIIGAINKALLSDPELSFMDINVDVNRGVVVLNGNTTTADAEQKVVALARAIRGVKDVKSRLIILPGTPNP